MEGAVSVNAFEQDRKRTAFDLAAQYKPTESMQFGVHYLSLALDANNANTTVFYFRMSAAPTVINLPPTEKPACWLPWIETIPPAGRTCKHHPRRQHEVDTLDFDFSYEGERYLLTARGGRTEASGGTDLTANFGARIGDPSDAYGTFDARGDQVALNLANPAGP